MSNRDVERSLLGGLFLDCSGLKEIRRDLGPEHFLSVENKQIYSAMLRLDERGDPIDATTVRAELKDSFGNGDASLIAVFKDLADGFPRGMNVPHYARLVRDGSTTRTVYSQAMALTQSMEANDSGSIQLDLAEAVLDGLRERSATRIEPLDLLSADVASDAPKFTVKNLVRDVGIHLFWAQPGAYKTTLLLRMALELLSTPRPEFVWGHPELTVYSGWKRVLWIATEEEAGRLKYRANAILRGLDNPAIPPDSIRYLFAAGQPRITIDDLPGILDRDGPFDAVFLDSLTGLRPKLVGKERIRWDADNDLANELLLNLRGLAVEHKLAVFLIHHSGKDGKTYRGPTEWWASADVMVGLRPDGDRVKIDPEKNRDGQRLESFYLVPQWVEDDFRVVFEGYGPGLNEGAQRVFDELKRRGPTAQANLPGLLAMQRTTVRDALKELKDSGLAGHTGEFEGQSPVWNVSGEDGSATEETE